MKGVYLCTTDYTEQAMEADRRLRRGERQLYCGVCQKWRWPEECDHPGRMTEREFKAMVRRMEKEEKRKKR